MADKPLPALPSPSLTTLSVDARNHRARLIQHFFSELDIHEPRIESKRDKWLHALEEALDDLSLHFSRGDWLSSIRRGRGLKQTSLSSHAVTIDKDQHDKPLPKSPDEPLKTLRLLITRSTPPPTEPRGGHLVLCVSPHRGPIPTEGKGFDIVPANIGCTFSGGSFSLHQDESDSTILYGLDGLGEFNIEESNIRLVGGTFAFNGVNSSVQHLLLSKILRLSIYVHLSLLLEQHLLSDSRVPIEFPQPVPTHLPPNPVEPQPTERKLKPRNSVFISNFLKRSFSTRSKKPRGVISETSVEAAPRDGRHHHFSFIGEKRPSKGKPTQTPLPRKPFEATLRRVEDSASLLSTSTGVRFKPPKVLVDLAEKEKTTQSRLLKADERIALSSLLGWDGKDAEGRGMSGILGFVRYQSLSVLNSRHIPPLPLEGSSASTTLPTTGLSICGKSYWTTYRYYSSGDKLLGDIINDFATNVNLPCERPGCLFTRGQHESRIIHGGIRIVIRTNGDVVEDSVDNLIQMWQSCAVCEARTPRTNIHDGTFLFSFAKFLELLVYSATISTSNPFLCDHTTPPSGNSTDLPASRLNIVRHFSTASVDVSFALSKIEDIFELKVPRLQIVRDTEKASVPQTPLGNKESSEDDARPKKELRREIKKWWEGVADHIDKIEKFLERDDTDTFLTQKALPRLPSTDDAYDIFHPSSTDPLSPVSPTLPSQPPTTPYTPSPATNEAFAEDTSTTVTATTSEVLTVPTANSSSHESSNTSPVPTPSTNSSSTSTISTATSTTQPLTPLKDNSEKLLMALRHNFHQIEQSLYTLLAKTSNDSLNEARSTFLSTGRGTQKRLSAWQRKHLGPKAKLVGDLVAEEPAWWSKDSHVVPRGNIIVRENDWGSIIAHTLSTPDYQLELHKFSTARSSSSSESQPSTPPTSPPEDTPSSSSFFSVATGYKLFTFGSRKQPDPDQEGVVWNEPEQYYCTISRKESSRGPLGMRDILRQKKLTEPSSSEVSTPGVVRGLSNSSAHAVFAKGKPDVVSSAEAANGKVDGPDALAAVDQLIFQELTSVTMSPTSTVKLDKTPAITPALPDSWLHTESEKAPSVTGISVERGESEETVRQDREQDSSNIPLTTPPLPPKDFVKKEIREKEVVDPLVGPKKEPEGNPATSSSFATVVASGLNSAVRFITNTELLSGTVSSPPNTKPHHPHHALLVADISNIDERPHIKYDWTIGKRLKFSCTVYYAKQFDALRRRCGINDLFLKSLITSANWSAQGGKSRSNFWKTSDDRFIIKSLVNAWNVADLQVLIELAPSYFRYMDATASKATVLAKLLGFYTIEIKNLETGTVQSKADLLVTENLFYNRNISKTFDLKGIQGRKVKTHGNTSKTLFDGEWIEGQQRTPMLVQPHSKIILRDGIKSDTEFLSKSNIMDYSLLLGVDEEKKQIACGLVDTIGSYTFAKTLEYKAKQGLQSGKEVTVIPPGEYRNRFVSVLEDYFIACPDKWSKPLDEANLINDPNLLSSVL